MRNLVNQFVQLCDTNEEFQRRMVAYETVLKTKQWKFVRDVFLTIKGKMLEDVFSETFTNLTAEEKDITQKTYHNINEILDFLSNPTRWVRRKSIYKQFSTDLAKRLKKGV